MGSKKKRHAVLLGLISAALTGADCSVERRTVGGSGSSTSGAGGATGTSSSQSSASTTSTSTSAVSVTTSSSSSTGTSGPTSSSSGLPTPRRPFLVGSSLRSAGTRWRKDWLAGDVVQDDVDLDPATRALLAQSWLADGIDEHASVAAFARWTLHMLSVGAPPHLIRESQLASLDEIAHAEACFALAKRYGAGDVGPGRLDLTGTVEPLSLVDIAVITAEEGCAGETLGVAAVMEQEERCKDPVVRDVLAGLVRDEQRHSWLTWAFIAWAIREGGPQVKDAVIRAISRATSETLEMPTRSYDGIDLVAWREHGRLTCSEVREIVADARDAVLRPAVAMH